jgi:hypothetical protein
MVCGKNDLKTGGDLRQKMRSKPVKGGGRNMRQGAKRGGDPVTASEIACWAYCPEQWRLSYGMGLAAENRAALEAGERRHGRKATAERIAGAALGLGRLLLIAGLALLLFWVLRR